MNKKEKIWGTIILIIVISCYVIPYTIFQHVTKWYGSFLVWTVLAIIAILINVKLTEAWGDKE
ncbi:hypothetical protein [Gracilibacillus alcaliphilus]|uniref:hypothetical protein n=1 Tax=Gracilibacillus alcaliphilus TaxID=1401441 RepID=UPI001958C9BE|nr:hypothetical protein [Gracilibacillus alcaliphilus]MBM7675573.1 hypothetical protein [Gracilibacillus alcaliphilus]